MRGLQVGLNTLSWPLVFWQAPGRGTSAKLLIRRHRRIAHKSRPARRAVRNVLNVDTGALPLQAGAARRAARNVLSVDTVALPIQVGAAGRVKALKGGCD